MSLNPPIRREFQVVDSPDPTALIREAEKQEEEEEKKEQPAIAPAPPEPEDYETRRRQLEEEIGKARAEAEHLQARAEEEAAALLASARKRRKNYAGKQRKNGKGSWRKRRKSGKRSGRGPMRPVLRRVSAAGEKRRLRNTVRNWPPPSRCAGRRKRRAPAWLELAEEERRARIMESEGEILKLAVEIAENNYRED